MFKVRDNGAYKMYFRCVLRSAVALLSLPNLYLERDMQYLKFGLVFDLKFLHKLNLYQVKKTLLNLYFPCFFIPRFPAFVNLRK